MLNKFYIEEKSERIDKYITLITLFMLLVIPILSYKYESISVSPVVMNNYYGTGMKSNIFNFYKSIALYIGSGSILSLFIYKVLYLEQNLKKSKVNIAVLIFIVAICLSAFFSEYKSIALMGNFDRNEGSIAWICYLTIFFVLYNINIEEKYFKYFYYTLIPFLIINVFLGISNLYGYNLLESSFIQTILGGNRTLGGILWTTLYHYNFMSGIAAVMFGVSLVYLFLEKNSKEKIILFLGTIMSFTLILTSNSIGGFLTVLLLVFIIPPIVYKFVDKKELIKWSGALFILCGFIYIILNSKNPMVYNETFRLFEKINNISKIIIPSLIVLYIGILFILSKVDKKKFFKNSLIIVLSLVTVSVSIYSYNIEKENKAIESSSNKSSIVRMNDNDIFKRINEMSTDRLNIWTKTIDLINDKPLLGHGFDTFPYIFISNDIDNGYSTYGEIIDKPHNWYLSISYGCGLIGLIGLLSIIIYILRGAIYNFIDGNEDKYIYIYSIGCIAYAIQGMFNDSLVGTSIIFWIFAGIYINRLNKI